ncbi:MAG: AzlD domain-containing protein [Peptostreptococcaceae bacterium]|jgi:branched-subunit amino acid transport protein|nr:AzlD domain-containing protein [Peptostreptococcaceae bacterium]
MNNLLFVIFGMMLVTYIPRLIPFYLVTDKNINKKLDLFLKFIPYTALGALVIPGVFNAIPNSILASTTGALFALLYAYYKGGIIIPVIGSIVVSFLSVYII